MAEVKYGIVKATPSLPARDLLFPIEGNDLALGWPAFGPNNYNSNLTEMQKVSTHSPNRSSISFREPTTSESISAVAYDVAKIKAEILDPRWLQLGVIVRTSEGVYVNPPRDKGNVITDEGKLKSILAKKNKVNGIYLGDNEFGFAPYESFPTGVQDADTFTHGGLARVLEHSSKKSAKNLAKIASSKVYPRGVNVFGFDKVEQPIVRVASLVSVRYLGGSGLYVDGGDWGNIYGGFAFGVLVSADEVSVPKKI